MTFQCREREKIIASKFTYHPTSTYTCNVRESISSILQSEDKIKEELPTINTTNKKNKT